MKISVITLFPQMFDGPFDHSIIKNAINNKLIEIDYVDLRNFGIGKHKVVDDKPYGGGIGMVLKVDVLKNAIDETIDKKFNKNEQKIVLLNPSGEVFNQSRAKSYSRLKHLILVCGHYEGVDARIRKYVDEELSIGNYVLTGGELGAIPVIDATARLVTGVLKDEATYNESHSNDDYNIEYPQYTRPGSFEGQVVPEVLLSGDHKKIAAWKIKEAKK